MSEVTKKEHTDPKPTYISNPFTLSFEALGRFFSSNVGWAIAIIVFGVFGFFTQMAGNIASSSTPKSTPTYNYNTSYNAPTHYDATAIIAIVIVVFVFLLVAVIVGSVISVFIKGMFSYVALESEKGKSVSFGEAFQAVSKRFWRLFWAELLAGLKILGWLCLLIVPGIIAAYRYALLSYVIMDESESEKGVIESHNRVKTLVKGRLIEVFGVATVAGIVPFVGSLLGLAGNSALYRQLQVYNDHKLEKPKKHWLNYLGFMLFAVILLFVAMIALLAIAIAAGKHTY